MYLQGVSGARLSGTKHATIQARPGTSSHFHLDPDPGLLVAELGKEGCKSGVARIGASHSRLGRKKLSGIALDRKKRGRPVSGNAINI